MEDRAHGGGGGGDGGGGVNDELDKYRSFVLLIYYNEMI